MNRNSRVRQCLLASIQQPEVQAVILYGPRTSDKGTLLRTAIDELAQEGRFLPVPLHLCSSLTQSRVEIMHNLASVVIDVTGQRSSLLDELSPSNFHTDFMAQIISGLPPSQRLLFVLDEINFQDRSQLSKLNNLILPLLRRLARLEQIKFILAVEEIEITKIQAVLHPIFTSVNEIEVDETEVDEIEVDETEALETTPTVAESTPNAQQADGSTSARRRSLLLPLLLIVILVLLVNIYLLLTMLRQLPPSLP